MLDTVAPQDIFRVPGQTLKQAGEVVGAPRERQNIATDIASGVGQLGSQILASLVNPNAAIGMMFAQGVDQQAERQEASGTEGRDFQSDIALLAGGAITAGTEKIGLDQILNRIPPKIRNDLMRQAADLAIAGGIEAVQEVAEGVAQGVL